MKKLLLIFITVFTFNTANTSVFGAQSYDDIIDRFYYVNEELTSYYFEKGEYKKVIEICKCFIELSLIIDDSDFTDDIYSIITQSYERLFGLDLNDSEDLKKLVKICPNDSFVLARLAFDYANYEEYDKALEYAKKALELDNKNVLAFIAIVGAYGEMGNIDKAKEYLEKILEMYPDFTFIKEEFESLYD